MSPPQQLRQHTSNYSSLLIYRPRKEERPWPSWLTYSGWLTHISGHPSATSRAHDSESTSAKDQCSTAGPRNHKKKRWNLWSRPPTLPSTRCRGRWRRTSRRSCCTWRSPCRRIDEPTCRLEARCPHNRSLRVYASTNEHICSPTRQKTERQIYTVKNKSYNQMAIFGDFFASCICSEPRTAHFRHAS